MTLARSIWAGDFGWLGVWIDARPAHRSTRSARPFAASQERHRRSMRLAQVRPRPVLHRGHVLAHDEPVGLVSLSVHHQNIGVLMTHDFEAHVPIPPDWHGTRAGGVARRRLNSEWIAFVFARLSPPPSSAASATKPRVASGAQQGRKCVDSWQINVPRPDGEGGAEAQSKVEIRP